MSGRRYTEAEVRAVLCRVVERTGGVRAAARAWGLSPSYVSDMRLGRRAPSEDVCKILGVVRRVETTYEDDPTTPRAKGGEMSAGK